MEDRQKIEARVIRNSVLFSLGFSAGGILFGILLSSSYLLFDGIFSLIGFGLGFLTLKVSYYVSKQDNENFPFGKDSIETFIVLFQYVVTLYFLSISVKDAIIVVLNGGEPVQLGFVIIYMILNTIIVYLVYVYVKIKAKQRHSVLLDSQLEQWRISSFMTTSATLGFIVAQVFILFRLEVVSYYVDSVILIVSVLFLVKTPALEIIKATKELIGMKTIKEKDIEKIKKIINDLSKEIDAVDVYTRLSKSSNLIFIEVDFVVDRNFKYERIEDQDRIREVIEERLTWLNYNQWLTISFTTKRRFAM